MSGIKREFPEIPILAIVETPLESLEKINNYLADVDSFLREIVEHYENSTCS